MKSDDGDLLPEWHIFDYEPHQAFRQIVAKKERQAAADDDPRDGADGPELRQDHIRAAGRGIVHDGGPAKES
ncbi:hypothetical protein [Methylobacterium variabile]|uniref:hypothetical protein n=1 Tax=Methylobacterium variabile TaxID=298794 RepID=UPI0012ECFD56|nr:hypothetical protein [Methylobacterium variabile]